MSRVDRIAGFYAVLDRDDPALAKQLVMVARVLQIRIKPGDALDIVRVAKYARKICDDAGALLVVNDRVDIALAAGADGVHLGQTDLPIAAARAIAPQLVVGVSTHNVEQVAAAITARADYLGFGPVFATSTKQNPDPVQGVAGLRTAIAAAGKTPVVAIGGITADHARAVYAAGAAAICAISAVNGASDVVAAARSFQR